MKKATKVTKPTAAKAAPKAKKPSAKTAPKAKKPSAKTAAPTKAAVKTKKPADTRMALACRQLQAVKTFTEITEVAEATNAAYVKSGGADNMKQTVHLIKVLLPAAVEWGVVERDGDKVKSC
jgi:hypothetical protein